MLLNTKHYAIEEYIRPYQETATLLPALLEEYFLSLLEKGTEGIGLTLWSN